MTILNYFAYGSNLHPLRLSGRLSDVELVSTAEVREYQLNFHKKGRDGSAKCNIVYTGNSSDIVFGAVYRLSLSQQQLLHVYEGKGAGYNINPIQISTRYGLHDCFTYSADPSYIDNQLQPYTWYKSLVLAGAQYLHFPSEYIQTIEAIATTSDTNQQRKKMNEKLIEDMYTHSTNEA